MKTCDLCGSQMKLKTIRKGSIRLRNLSRYECTQCDHTEMKLSSREIGIQNGSLDNHFGILNLTNEKS